jgi:hypothetical protein
MLCPIQLVLVRISCIRHFLSTVSPFRSIRFPPTRLIFFLWAGGAVKKLQIPVGSNNIR